VLDFNEMLDIFEAEVLKKEQDMNFASKLVTCAVQYLAIPVAALEISAVVARLLVCTKGSEN